MRRLYPGTPGWSQLRSVVGGPAGLFSGVFHLLTHLLHVLARAADGVAGGEGTGGEQGKQQQCSQTLHVTSPFRWGGRRGRVHPRQQTPSLADRKSVV